MNGKFRWQAMCSEKWDKPGKVSVGLIGNGKLIPFDGLMK
jgi:hypothetical protein